MSRLTVGMYGDGRNEPFSKLFGIRTGQSGSSLAHNAGWYNRAGERLGIGSLSADDMERISSELEEDELFIVLPERHVEIFNWFPGVDFVVEHCGFIISPGQIWGVYRFDGDRKGVARIGRDFSFSLKALQVSLVKPFLLEGVLPR